MLGPFAITCSPCGVHVRLEPSSALYLSHGARTLTPNRRLPEDPDLYCSDGDEPFQSVLQTSSLKSSGPRVVPKVEVFKSFQFCVLKQSDHRCVTTHHFCARRKRAVLLVRILKDCLTATESLGSSIRRRGRLM